MNKLGNWSICSALANFLLPSQLANMYLSRYFSWRSLCLV